MALHEKVCSDCPYAKCGCPFEDKDTTICLEKESYIKVYEQGKADAKKETREKLIERLKKAKDEFKLKSS